MAETSKNKIYYNDDENSAADVLADMKKLAQSTDDAIEKSKYNDTQIKKDISNIKDKDTEQDKYIVELEAENTRLREDLNGLPKGQASGESIDLNDSAEMRCELKISGNSKQESRSGKNLFNINKPNYQSSYSPKVVDNKIVCNNNQIWSSVYFIINGLSKNTYYTISSLISKTSGEAFSQIYKGEGVVSENVIVNYNINSNGNQTTTFNTGEYSSITITFCASASNSVFEISNIQLEEGSIATDFEQYGASPSPDYPSEVESCGDNINLFDKDNANKIQDTFIGITGSVGTATANQIVYVECKKNATITVQKKVSTRFRVATYSSTDIVGKTLSNVKVNDAGTSITITSGEKDTYLFVQYIGPDDKDNSATILKTLKIAYSSKETGYSEYGQGCINEVICNKNLLKIVDGTYTNQGITTIIKDSKIKSSGTTTTTYADINNISSLFDINIKSGCEYTFSRTKTSEYRLWIRLYNSASDIQDAMIAENSKSVTFIANSNYNKCYLFYTNFKADKTLSIDDFQVMIAEGSTVTDYEEHKSQTYTIPVQQPMRSVGDTRDTFIKKDGKRYEHHPIVRIESYNGETITTEYVSNTGELSTGATVDYISDTPLDIECTEEQSTILFDIEQNAKTYDKVTHMYSTDNVSPVIDVTYKKDIETLFANTLVEGV